MNTVISKVIEASKKIAAKGIGRDAYNKEQGFWYRRIEDIVGAVNAAISEVGLCIYPSSSEVSVREVTERKSGGHTTSVVVLVAYTVTAPEARDGESIVVRAVGEAKDTADKAVAKAMTAAYKSAMGQLFHIPFEGVDNDADESVDAEPAELERARAAAKEGLAAFTAYWKRLAKEQREALMPYIKELEETVKANKASND